MATKFDGISKSTLPLAEHRSLALLEEGAGTLGRLRARSIARKEAQRSLAALTVARALTVERVVAAELAATEATVVGAIMAQGQQTVAALTEEVTAETGVYQTRLTTLGGAERISHVTKRFESYGAIDARLSQKAISSDEAEALKGQADADLVRDIELTNARVSKSKDLIESLHGDIIGALKRATQQLR